MKSKYTTALRTTVSIKTLRKIKLESSETGKKPVLVVEFSGHFYYPPEKWAMIPYEDYKRVEANL